MRDRAEHSDVHGHAVLLEHRQQLGTSGGPGGSEINRDTGAALIDPSQPGAAADGAGCFLRMPGAASGVGRSNEGAIMKTDSDLKKDVMAELTWDPAVKADAVGVAVNNGVVTLSGHLDTYAEKFAAERALRRVAGVQAIALELDVRLAPQHKRSDTDIAAAAEQALRWHTSVPADKIRLIVENGWVRLQGEVEWEYQRRSVEKAIRPLVGVVGISNEIALKAKPVPADLAGRIEGALKRQALYEAKRVEVSIAGSTVTLRGSVQSWQERDAVQGAVWSAPGVRSVINELRVGA
jgi:osmotically-inducible protein OsmY